MLVLIVLNDPGENRILRQIIERAMRYKVQVEKVIAVAYHTSLPCVLVIADFL